MKCLANRFFIFVFFVISISAQAEINEIALYDQAIESCIALLHEHLEVIAQMECVCPDEREEDSHEGYVCGADITEVMRIQLTSSNVYVSLQDDQLFAGRHEGSCEPYFGLKKGDHNLWYGNSDDLWGYDIMGRLFQITRDNKRILQAKLPIHFAG